MNNFKYQLARLLVKVTGNDEHYADMFRAAGVKIGINSHIYSNILTPESFLIEIGDNVTISSDVIFVTHDNSVIKIDYTKPNLFGKITIGNNCFIGQRSMLLYGVTLADSVIVAAGSVVTKSFDESNIIIGGNPARKISSFEKMAISLDKALSRKNIQQVLKEYPDKLVRR